MGRFGGPEIPFLFLKGLTIEGSLDEFERMQTPFYLTSRFQAAPTGVLWLGILALLPILAGCAGPSNPQKSKSQAPSPAIETRPTPPIAYWRLPQDRGRGTSIQFQDIEPIVVEIAGRRALQEAVLDEVLDRELRTERIRVTDDAIQTELTILLNALDMDEERAQRLLLEIRRREGLGPYRFAALLRRNASLRALIQNDVVMRPEAVRAAWDAIHGPRRIARVFVADDLNACNTALERFEEGVPFAEIAAQSSTDPSASTGGLIDPVSRLDPSWPTVFRDAVWSLSLDEISSPILVDGEYVLAQFIEEIPGDGIDFETGQSEAEVIVRRAQERLLMDATAQRLLDSTQVDIINSDLRNAWTNNPNATTSSLTPSARMPAE